MQLKENPLNGNKGASGNRKQNPSNYA